jgi:hypothetical protein
MYSFSRFPKTKGTLDFAGFLFLFFAIYIGILYLEQKQNDEKKIIENMNKNLHNMQLL